MSTKTQARVADAGWAGDIWRGIAANRQQRQDEQTARLEQQQTIRALATAHGEAFLDAVAAALEGAAHEINTVAGAPVVRVLPRELGEACHLDAHGARLAVQPDFTNLDDLFPGLRVFMRCHGCDDLSPRPFGLTATGGLFLRGQVDAVDGATAARAIFTAWMQTAHIGN
jgi:hypothetical protein